jgi:hypothetical protein
MLEDLHLLDVTTTTDMAADWKLVGVGGGVKNSKLFCTLCPLESNDVHVAHENLCERICRTRNDDSEWRCYHHPFFCGSAKESLLEEGGI